MITSDELAFVRLAMRKRILSVNTVQEAVERKRWDAPDRPIADILIDMGALEPEAVARLRRALEDGAGERREGREREEPRRAATSSTRQRQTEVGRDPNARDARNKDDKDAGREAKDEKTERDTSRSRGPGRGVPERVGPYKLLRLLGAGAMGAVYHARHAELERDVALKLLQSEGAPTARAIARFKREARLAARLDHPNIVRVYEAGLEDGQHFIAMDMVRGRSVGELITLNEITARRAVHLMRRVAEAVGYAHEQGVIHRDLKPANILVDEKSGDPRVTDFGLAVLAEPDEDDKLTRTGAAVGTPAYMAPEQVRGRLDEIDQRTDVYALGATLYEMLTGSPPFDAPTFLELAKRICEADPVAPRRRNPQVPADVETVCLKALEKDPAQRYATAFDMARDLAAFIDDAPIVAQRPSTVELARRWARRRPGVVAAAAGFLVVLLIGLGVYLSTPGTLEITTIPAGAVVKVDGIPQKDEQGGVLLTPEGGYLRLSVPAGEHDLTFEKAGFLERAVFVGSVDVGHGRTRTLTATLVSTSGLLQVTTSPPGAPVRVLTLEGAPRADGVTPFLQPLEAGQYRVVVGAMPGFLAPDELVRAVASGGAPTVVPTISLRQDVSRARVESDPDGADLAGEGSRITPVTVPGAGRHTLELSKAGYLPRRLELDVPAGGQVERRASLRPLAESRRLLEGKLLAGPLVDDVDGDGQRDLVLLEEVPDGARLTLFPGGGEEAHRFHVATASTVTTLIGLEDTDGDGVLDVLLGGPTHIEVRDGRTGRQLAQATGWDARGALLHRPKGAPAQVVVLEEARRPRALPATLAGVAPRAGPAPPREAPGRGVMVAKDVRSLTEQFTAVFPVDGGLVVWAPEGNGAPSEVQLAGVTRQSQVAMVVVERGADEWVVAVPAAGPAHVVDPRAPSRHYLVGEATSRFDRPAFTLADRPWLVLTEGGRSRLFALGPTEPKEFVPDPVPGPGAVVLRDLGEETAGLEPPKGLWTLAGEVLLPVPNGWAHDPAASTDPSPWIAPGGEPVVADLDRDGAPEVLLASPDRRAVVVLDPLGDGARWRARASRPDAAAVVALDGPNDLALGQGDRLVALSGDDGRTLGELQLPGRCLDVAPAGEPGVVHAVVVAASGEGSVLRLRWGKGAWATEWVAGRPALGVAPLSLDVDGDKRLDLAVSGPLAVLRAADGREAWAERLGGRAEAMGSARPCVAPGSPPLVLGVRDPSRAGEPALVVAHDPATPTAIWESPLAVEGDAPRALLADEDQPIAVVVLGRRMIALGRTDGHVRWTAELGDLVGAALAGGRVIAARAAGDVVALDAASGAPVWLRALPVGRPGSTPSSPLRLPKEGPDEECVAIVAPSGALLLLSSRDGALLGERRTIEGAYLPWLLRWPVSAPGRAAGAPPLEGLVLATDDGRLSGRLAGPRRRPEVVQRRARMREQVRRLDEAEQLARLARAVTVTPGVTASSAATSPVAAALAELESLVTDNPSDATAQLALARGALAAGQLEKAQQAARAAQRARPRLPEALRVMVEATFAQRGTFDSVDGLLDELAQVDPAQAAEVAVVIARQSDGDPSRFLRRCRDLAPRDPGVRRLLGLVRLERIGKRVWTAVGPDELLDARRSVAEARVELVLSLVQDDAPEAAPVAEARAAALVALVLERRITAVFYARRQNRPDHERAAILVAQLSGLAAPTGPAPPGEAGQLLEKARALAGLGDQDDASALCDELRRLRPRWEDALQGIAALRP